MNTDNQTITIAEQMKLQQDAPKHGDFSIAESLLKDPTLSHQLRIAIKSRDEFGTQKYGRSLMSNNGRDVEVDTLQEIIDGIFYAQQAIMEGKGNVYRYTKESLTELFNVLVGHSKPKTTSSVLNVLFPDETINDFDMEHQENWLPHALMVGGYVTTQDGNTYLVKETNTFFWGVEAKITTVPLANEIFIELEY